MREDGREDRAENLSKSWYGFARFYPPCYRNGNQNKEVLPVRVTTVNLIYYCFKTRYNCGLCSAKAYNPFAPLEKLGECIERFPTITTP